MGSNTCRYLDRDDEKPITALLGVSLHVVLLCHLLGHQRPLLYFELVVQVGNHFVLLRSKWLIFRHFNKLIRHYHQKGNFIILVTVHIQFKTKIRCIRNLSSDWLFTYNGETEGHEINMNLFYLYILKLIY